VYEDRYSKKNLNYNGMLRAIRNIEKAGFELAGQFISLNAWSY
jgi:hypothetical protein